MLTGKTPRKAIAATCLLLFFTETFAPSISYALTSGPTQPEATSFEPIDTTDMVNLQTGDFTYNIPLLEVPGPEGSYPLSLSYHAGIQPNEDASWVGLGWTLNPGAIDRTVNGFPDDWNGDTTSSHVYWTGGNNSTYDVGISVGLANCATVGAGLSFSSDTYRGFSIGGYADVSVGFKAGPIGINATLGVGESPDGTGYVFGGAGIGIGGDLNASLGVSFTNTFKGSSSVGFTGGVGYSIGGTAQHRGYSGSLLGVSIGTGDTKPSLSIGGLTSSVVNSKANNISTSSHGWHVDIPIYEGINLSLGHSKTRYWTNETVGVATYGSMNYNTFGSDYIANDEYSLLEDPGYKNIMDYGDPTTVQGGSYFNYDLYNVNAQGLGGNMRPYMFQGSVRYQTIKNGSTTNVGYYSPSVANGVPFYRFENDFSNSYRQNYPAYPDPSFVLATPPFDASPAYGNGDGTTGFNPANGNGLAGSKHVDIGPLIHPVDDYGYNSADRLRNGMIEGFSITNESGVTYHFGLPAYAYNEENYQEKIDQSGGATGNRETKSGAYAYTWYLTTITGPDFVDRNGDGVADDGDWGYWVNFQYGKWSNRYNWRNPSEGFRKDEDNTWQDVSMGTREVYYLNAIHTRTHIAIFEKNTRYDAKGASPEIFNKVSAGNIAQAGYANQGVYNSNSSQSLLLSKIYLLNASDSSLVTAGMGGSQAYTPNRSIACSDCELPQNVIDQSDVAIAGRAALEAKALKVIDFNYDYSLCANTTNSFDIFNPSTVYGKLTLQNVVTRGKSGANLTPPISFGYDLTGADQTSQTGVTLNPVNGSNPANFTTTNGNFKTGDLIWANVNNVNVFCGMISAVSGSGTYTYTLTNCQYTGSATTANVWTTKDPPYNKDFYDIWGMYKSDLSLSTTTSNENLGRQTSPLSSKAADVWSLRTITSPLGDAIKVYYESDTYSQAGAGSSGSLELWAFSNFDYVNGYISFNVATNGYKLSDFLSLGNKVDFMAMQPVRYDQDPLCYYASYSLNSSTACSQPTTYLGPPAGPIFDPDYSKTNALPNNFYYFRIVDTRPYGGATITSIDDVNSTLTVYSNALRPYFAPISNTIEYAGGQIPYTGVTTYRHLAPVAGNLFFNSVRNIYGGGIRVKSVALNNSVSGNISSTNYNYLSTDNVTSSGVTSYEPTILDYYDVQHIENANNLLPVNLNELNVQNASPAYRAIKYKRVLYRNNNSLYSVARELPTPGVIYQYVTVSNQVRNPDEASARNIEGSTQYQFEVFRNNMVGISDVTPRTGPVPNSTYGPEFSRNLVLQKFTGSIGNLKRTVTFDNNGNKISEVINNYLHDGLESLPLGQFMSQYKTRLQQYAYKGLNLNYSYQGLLEERVVEVKDVENQPNSADNGKKATLSAKEVYPCIQIGQTAINYVNGTTTTSTNVAFDFYSGAITKTLETDAYGNNFVTQTLPAYRQNFGDINNVGMGLKVNFDHNLNMLTQTAESYRWKTDATGNALGLVSANVTFWSNQVPVIDVNGTSYSQNNGNNPPGDVWRQQSTYAWLPTNVTTDGTTPFASFADFNWASPSSSNANWKNTTNVTLYDVYSKALEGNDINGTYSTTKMNYGDQRVALTGGPAKFYEIAYSGAEDGGISQTASMFVHAADATVSTTAAHTGVQSLSIPAGGKKGFLYSVPISNLTVGRTYQASVWVQSGNSNVSLQYDVSGTVKGTSTRTSGTSLKTANGWSLINLTINGSDITSGTLDVYAINSDPSAVAYADDFRFQPLNATTTAYIYDPFSGELTYTLDNNNIYTNFVYDAVGRLASVYREKLGTGVFKTNDYTYNYGASKFLSDAVTNAGYTRNNCSPGYLGTTVMINFPQGAYISYLSLADADYLADLGGQETANRLGNCLPYSTVPVTISSGMLSSVSFSQGGTVYAAKSFVNSGGSMNVPNGTYTVTVTQTNNVSHTVNIPPYGSQTGSSVTFTNVVVPGVTVIQVTN